MQTALISRFLFVAFFIVVSQYEQQSAVNAFASTDVAVEQAVFHAVSVAHVAVGESDSDARFEIRRL